MMLSATAVMLKVPIYQMGIEIGLNGDIELGIEEGQHLMRAFSPK